MNTILTKNYTLVKTSHNQQILKLEFNGNLDLAIEKMKRNVFSGSVEPEKAKMQLKSCLLFLYGMTFSQIAECLSTSKGQISRYLNDEKLEDLLSFEYQILFQRNKFRLKQETVEQKIEIAVRIFVEQHGDYQKTAELTGFSERSLSRYFAEPNLQTIIKDEKLYHQFLETMKLHTSSIKSEAAICGAQKQKIKHILKSLNPNSIVEKRYIMLCEKLFVEGVTDIKVLSEKTGMSEKNIHTYLEDFSRVKDFFPFEILTLLNDVSLSLLKDETAEFSKEDYERAIIEYYMKSRYSYEELRCLLELSSTQVYDILNNRSKTLLSTEEYEQLLEHKKEVMELSRKTCRKKDNYLVKDPRLIDLVKSEITSVSSKDYQILDVVLDFLELYQSIVKKDLISTIYHVDHYLLLHMNRLKELLTEYAFNTISAYLRLESLLFGNDLKEKHEYITLVVHEFFKNNLDLVSTSQSLNIPVECLIRILQNEFVSMNYGSLIAANIKMVIEQFRNSVKIEEKRNIDYTYFLKK